MTHGGDTPLDIKLLLRPTSETAMYPLFSLWIRSHANLPLKTYQIVNTFRYETKQTRPFIRVREIHFFEAHTCHATFEDAESQIEEDIKLLEKLSKKLCIPYILSRRPEWDKFAGAYYSISADTPLVTDRTLQIATIHQYKDNFAKAFNITYEDMNGARRYVYQTTFGMSERLIGAIIAVHSDNFGLILPPEVAPYQIVIVPIYTKDDKDIVLDWCNRVKNMLQSYRVHLDLRELRPGYKYYYWELKGVPIRFEIGIKEVEERCVTFVRRDTKQKCIVKIDNLLDEIPKSFQLIEENMFKRATEDMHHRIITIPDLNIAQDLTGVIRTGWCGDEDCGHAIEQKTDMHILGIPVLKEKENFEGRCICGKNTNTVIYVAKTY